MEEDDFLYEMDPLAEEDFIQNPLELFIEAVAEAVTAAGRVAKRVIARSLERVYRPPARGTVFPKAVDPDAEIKRLERISAERARNLLLARETKAAKAAGMTLLQHREFLEEKSRKDAQTAAKRDVSLKHAQEALSAKKAGMQYGSMEWGLEKKRKEKIEQERARERAHNLRKAQNALQTRRRRHV